MTEDPPTQSEKRSVLENDRRVAEERLNSTLHGRAIAEVNEAGGRYGLVDKTTVVGGASLSYPTGNEWAAGDQAVEPPLNFQAISTPEPVGTYKEVQQSLERLGAVALPPDPPDGEGSAPVSARLPADIVIEETPSPFSDDNDELPPAA